jgi:hypothetical protein
MLRVNGIILTSQNSFVLGIIEIGAPELCVEGPDSCSNEQACTHFMRQAQASGKYSANRHQEAIFHVSGSVGT